jgi:hypothetical protein
MAKQRIIDFISENYCVYRTMMVKGHIPMSKITEYKIYCHYQELPIDMPKMEKYSNTAIKFNVSEIKVMRAVKSMEQNI